MRNSIFLMLSPESGSIASASTSVNPGEVTFAPDNGRRMVTFGGEFGTIRTSTAVSARSPVESVATAKTVALRGADTVGTFQMMSYGGAFKVPSETPSAINSTETGCPGSGSVTVAAMRVGAPAGTLAPEVGVEICTEGPPEYWA
jgi:hypothetical protein